jgi:hypothetical protein
MPDVAMKAATAAAAVSFRLDFIIIPLDDLRALMFGQIFSGSLWLPPPLRVRQTPTQMRDGAGKDDPDNMYKM